LQIVAGTLDVIPRHATTMFFPHFVRDACSREPHKLGKRCIRPKWIDAFCCCWCG